MKEEREEEERKVENGGEVEQNDSGIERDTSSHSRHPRCCLFCVKVNDKRGMKSAEKGKTTARVQSPPSQLIQLHAGGSHNGPLLLTNPSTSSPTSTAVCVCVCV